MYFPFEKNRYVGVFMAAGSAAHAPIMPLGSFSIGEKRLSLTSVWMGSLEELISRVPAIWKSSPKRLFCSLFLCTVKISEVIKLSPSLRILQVGRGCESPA